MFLSNIAGLLHDTGSSRANSYEIAELLFRHAGENDAGGMFYLARSYYGTGATWFSRAGNEELASDCLCAAAETFVREADAKIANDRRGHGVAAGFFASAIHAFRRVPRAMRAARAVDRRIGEIQRAMENSARLSMEMMTSISSGKIDLTELVEASIDSVKGKSLGDALYSFCTFEAVSGRQVYRTRAFDFFRNNPLQAMIEVELMAADSRVVARRPGVSFQDLDSPNGQKALRSVEMQGLRDDVPIGVQGLIIPALNVLRQEHRFVLTELVQLAQNSPIVAHDRVHQVAKAIYFGFEYDFVTALHLGVPQVEHIVRTELKRAGVTTTVIDAHRIEMEKGLSSLSEMTEFEEVFGEDLSFTIRAVFCDAFGLNFRNEVAHGLLSDDSANSVESVFVWWILLRLVFGNFVTNEIRGRTGPMTVDSDQ